MNILANFSIGLIIIAYLVGKYIFYSLTTAVILNSILNVFLHKKRKPLRTKQGTFKRLY